MDELRRANSAAVIFLIAKGLEFLSTFRSLSYESGRIALVSHERRTPDETGGRESSWTTYSTQRLLLEKVGVLFLRRSSVVVLSYREHLRCVVSPAVRSRVLALFTPNFREGFPKIGVNALGVTKGVIEDPCCA